MQRDIVLRWIEDMAALVARLLRGNRAVDLELARRHVEEAMEQLLGPLHALTARLEPASVAVLLHDPERLFAYARLLALAAAIDQADGLPGAEAARRRAIELARAALERTPEPPPEWVAWVEAGAREA